MKVYERTEDGTVTTVEREAGLAEINAAMMGETKKSVRTMSSINRTDYAIDYKDGRSVRLVLIDVPAPAEQPEQQGPTAWTGETTRLVTVKGKRYIVGTIVPARPRTPGATSWIPEAYVSYWSERGGKTFGATRNASASDKPGTVGRAIWDAVNQ